VRTLIIPRDAFWFASGDWGSNAPGAIHWWFDVGDGHWHVGLELKFQRESVETVAGRFREMNRTARLTRPCAAFVLDPACWTNAGDSIAAMFQKYKLPIVKGNNDRKNGWQRIHELLRPAPDGFPWVTIDAHRCPYLVRTLPAATSNANDPDDVDMSDDHALDSFRYGALSGFVTHRLGSTRKRSKPGTLGYYKQQQTHTPGVLARR
jgi:hypothetical protein